MRVMRQGLGGLRRLWLARRCCERLFDAVTAGQLLWRLGLRGIYACGGLRLLGDFWRLGLRGDRASSV